VRVFACLVVVGATNKQAETRMIAGFFGLRIFMYHQKYHQIHI
jgi:hypothetical protein